MANLFETRDLLNWARDLGKTVRFLDMHVHPFDVLSGDVAYRRNEHLEGVFSMGKAAYRAPADEPSESNEMRPASAPVSERTLGLAARLKYLHTGPKVFVDQLEITGLSGALLLPVARVPHRAEEMLDVMDDMFTGESRLMRSCAFPVGVPAQEISAFLHSAHMGHGIQGVKIHPNLCGVNPLDALGHELIEGALEAAGRLGLPTIVHGGLIAALSPDEAAEYGLLERLETVNWGLSSAPVIIAHAGCFDLRAEDVDASLARLNRLFERYPNLMADTSSLDPASLRRVLQRVGLERLVFGSDALYVSMRAAWVGFLRALREVSRSPDNDLVRIASVNAANCLGPHRSYAENFSTC
jgi:predicted TIM-barrel fold metal-dependent hydrolase